jgi:putative transposase
MTPTGTSVAPKLYVVLDIFSRYVPGWLVAHAEDAVVAKDFLADAGGP